MDNPNSILSMTEHGAYVWPCYVIAALILIGLVALSVRGLQRAQNDLARVEAEFGGRLGERDEA